MNSLLSWIIHTNSGHLWRKTSWVTLDILDQLCFGHLGPLSDILGLRHLGTKTNWAIFSRFFYHKNNTEKSLNVINVYLHVQYNDIMHLSLSIITCKHLCKYRDDLITIVFFFKRKMTIEFNLNPDFSSHENSTLDELTIHHSGKRTS